MSAADKSGFPTISQEEFAAALRIHADVAFKRFEPEEIAKYGEQIVGACDLSIRWKIQRARRGMPAKAVQDYFIHRMNEKTGKDFPCRTWRWPEPPDEEWEPGDPPETSNVVPLRSGDVAASIWKPKPWTWQDPKTIARLECLYGDHYWRGEVVSTVAHGGVGKSLLSIAEALAMVTGKPLLGEATRGGLKVMLMNYEDSELVLRHRVTAAMLHYGIKPAEIAGKLFVESIGSDLMRFAKGAPGGTQIVEPSVEALTKAIKSDGIDVVILDPWVSVHEVDGNLSHLVQPIVTAFKAIAEATGAAIEIVAHSRKPNGKELTEEDALGSVAFVNKTRDVRVLNKMASVDAAKMRASGLGGWRLFPGRPSEAHAYAERQAGLAAQGQR